MCWKNLTKQSLFLFAFHQKCQPSTLNDLYCFYTNMKQVAPVLPQWSLVVLVLYKIILMSIPFAQYEDELCFFFLEIILVYLLDTIAQLGQISQGCTNAVIPALSVQELFGNLHPL